MKRIIALLLTFLFLFACVSCKNSAGDETTAATALTIITGVHATSPI